MMKERKKFADIFTLLLDRDCACNILFRQFEKQLRVPYFCWHCQGSSTGIFFHIFPSVCFFLRTLAHLESTIEGSRVKAHCVFYVPFCPSNFLVNKANWNLLKWHQALGAAAIRSQQETYAYNILNNALLHILYSSK